MSGLLSFWREIPLQRRKRIVLFVLAAVIILVTLQAARSVLGLYFAGLVLAYLVAPIVDAIERGIAWLAAKIHFGLLRRIARSLSIIITYVLVVSLIAGFFALVVPVVVREAQLLWEARQEVFGQVSLWFEDLLEQYRLLPERVRVQIDDGLRDLGAMVTQVVQQALQRTAVVISYTFSVVLAIFIIPFWTFFLLRDYAKIRDSIYGGLPRALRADVRSIAKLLDATVGSFLRGELTLMLLVGIMQTAAMAILGVPYAPVLGVVAGLLEIVPNIGPVIAAIPAVLAALTVSPWLAVFAAVAAHIVQNIENAFLTPRILGGSVGIHPVVVMVVLVIGAEIGGVVGMVLAPVVTAVLRDTYRYLALRFADAPCSPEVALERVRQGESISLDI